MIRFLKLFILLSFSILSVTAASTNRTAIETTACVRRFVNDNGNSVTENYVCPGFSDSPDQVQCCDQSTEQCCVAPRAKKFYELPKQTAIIISTVVVLAAAILTGAIIVCCCWERCPLYMACRAEAKPDYIAKPEDTAGISLMPGDNGDNVKTYAVGKAASESERRC